MDFFQKTMAQGHILGLGLLCSPMFPHMFLFSHPLGFVFLRGDICNKSGKHPRNYSDKKRSQSNKSSTYLSWPNSVNLCSGSSPHESQILYDKIVWRRGTVTSCYPKHPFFLRCTLLHMLIARVELWCHATGKWRHEGFQGVGGWRFTTVGKWKDSLGDKTKVLSKVSDLKVYDFNKRTCH